VDVGGTRVVADATTANRAPLAHNQHVWLAFGPEACQVMSQ